MLNYINCGAYSNMWIHFEHINNLNVEELSILAKQIELVQQKMILADIHPLGLIEKTIKFSNIDDSSKIFNQDLLSRKDVSFGLFASFNGQNIINIHHKSKLKALQSTFRISSLMIPDFEIIIKYTLFGFGFKSFMILAKKIIESTHAISEKLKEFTNILITKTEDNEEDSAKLFILTYNDIYTILKLIKYNEDICSIFSSNAYIARTPTKNKSSNENLDSGSPKNISPETARDIKETPQQVINNSESVAGEILIVGNTGKKPKKEELNYWKFNTEADIISHEKIIIANVLLDYLSLK